MRSRRRSDRRSRTAETSSRGAPRAPVDGGGCYVRPAIVTMPAQTAIVQAETFAPLLHVLSYDDLDEAIALHNDVTQGLSSSIFTLDVREAERFVSATGSDCGIANVNMALPVRRSVARSAARRTPGVGASPGPTPGSPTCDARRTPSTTRRSCPWRRAWSSCERHTGGVKTPVVLDGGMSNALEDRGHDLSDALWTARLLRDDGDEIAAVHRAYFEAGARVATTASYQASVPGFGARGVDATRRRR